MIDVCANNTNVLVFMYNHVIAVLYQPTLCQVYVFLLSKIGLATHAFLPFENTSLNRAFPVTKYKTFNTMLQGSYGAEQTRFCSGLLTLCVIVLI